MYALSNISKKIMLIVTSALLAIPFASSSTGQEVEGVGSIRDLTNPTGERQVPDNPGRPLRPAGQPRELPPWHDTAPIYSYTLITALMVAPDAARQGKSQLGQDDINILIDARNALSTVEDRSNEFREDLCTNLRASRYLFTQSRLREVGEAFSYVEVLITEDVNALFDRTRRRLSAAGEATLLDIRNNISSSSNSIYWPAYAEGDPDGMKAEVVAICENFLKRQN